MRLDRFQSFAQEALPNAPDVQRIEPWAEGDHTTGLHVTFTSGSQIWLSTTMALAPGEKHEQPEAPVHGDPPAEVPVPELYENGKITPDRAKQYLAAALTNARCDEIALAYPYADDSHPGVGLKFHNGARIFCLFVHTARPGQSPSGKKYELQTGF
jgi:hypothetical protein